VTQPIERKVIGPLPGNADQQVEFIVLAGAIAVPFLYGAWANATGYPFIVGATLFIEGLWLVIVLLWLAAWDLGAWLGGIPPLRNPIRALVAPTWLVDAIPALWRARLHWFFDRYVHLVTLVTGLLIGHVYWH
jgi:hypothetical protein